MANDKKENKSKIVQFRLRPKELERLKKMANENDYLSLSELVRFSVKEQLLRHGVRNYA